MLKNSADTGAGKFNGAWKVKAMHGVCKTALVALLWGQGDGLMAQEGSSIAPEQAQQMQTQMQPVDVKAWMRQPWEQQSIEQRQMGCASFMHWRAQNSARILDGLLDGGLISRSDGAAVMQKKKQLMERLQSSTLLQGNQMRTVLEGSIEQGGLMRAYVQLDEKVSEQQLDAVYEQMQQEFERASASERKKTFDQCEQLLEQLMLEKEQQAVRILGSNLISQINKKKQWAATQYGKELRGQARAQLTDLGLTLGLNAQAKALQSAFGYTVLEYESMRYGIR